MAEYLIQDTSLQNIGNAIRNKTGTTASLTPAQMVTAINNISTIDESTLADLNNALRTAFMNQNMTDRTTMSGIISTISNYLSYIYLTGKSIDVYSNGSSTSISITNEWFKANNNSGLFNGTSVNMVGEVFLGIDTFNSSIAGSYGDAQGLVVSIIFLRNSSSFRYWGVFYLPALDVFKYATGTIGGTTAAYGYELYSPQPTIDGVKYFCRYPDQYVRFPIVTAGSSWGPYPGDL